MNDRALSAVFVDMARKKRPESDDHTPFVWEDGDPAEPRKPAIPARPAISPARVLIAAAVVLVLAGGTFGIVNLSSQESPGSKADAVGNPLPSTHPFALASPKTSAAPSASLTPSRAQPTSKSPTPSAPVTQAAEIRSTAAATPAAATASGPRPLAAWLLNGNALDSSGAHNGIASDISFANGAARLTGSNSSYIATSSTVLNTGPGASFTVSAWVDLTAAPTSASEASTAVSQDAGINSAFYLQYFGGMANCWAFARMDTDTVLSNAGRAESTSTPKYNTWTHLVGVYDASTSAVYLYVNGNLEGTAKDPTPFASSGPLVIGRARYNSKPSDAFTGYIKDVRVFSQALRAAAVEALD